MEKFNELIQSEEYWNELISNSLWRVKTGKSSVKNEKKLILNRIDKLKKILNELTTK